MIRRLAALSVLAFSFALVSYSGMATGQEKDTPKSTGKSTSKNTAKSSKKGKGTGDVPKTEKTDK